MLNDVPQPTQTLGQTQSLIRANFSAIDTAFSVNHVPYNDGTGNQGKHNLVDFPVQAMAPTLAAGDVGLYNLLNAVTGKNEMYLHKIQNATTADIPMSASILSYSTPVAEPGFGWTYLPSGILVKWDFNVTKTGQQNVLFRTGANIPVFNICFLVMPFVANGGAGDVNQAVRLTGCQALSFDVYCSARTSTGAAAATFAYVAIGY